MKKTLLLSLLVAASTSITAFADSITVVPGYGPYDSNGGGEITALLSTPLSGYVPGVTSGIEQSGTFQTFCVERNEHLVNGTYIANPADMTQLTGYTLTRGVAWLYEEFCGGTLASYAYAGTLAQRIASSAALQSEIWYLMGNEAPMDAALHALVVQNVSDWDKANTPDFSPVKVLNLWSPQMVGSREGAQQDVLYIPGLPSVPDGGLTLALLGMGLTGVGMISRRSRK